MHKDILKRYFENTCTAEEREQVTAWLSDLRNREDMMQYIDDDWRQWQPSEDELDQATLEANLPFRTLHEHVAARNRSGNRYGFRPGTVRILKVAAGIAASVLFLLAGTGIGYYFKGKSAQQRKAPVYYATAETLHGQRSKLVLGDGSEVWLNAGSRLSFSSEVSARQVVYLEGEAYFKVPDKEKSLIVKTKDLVASAKGSHFNISAFPKDSTVTVSVDKGKAEIRPNEEKTFPLLALRIPSRDSTKRSDSASQQQGQQQKPKTMPMMMLRPVVVNANQTVTYDRNNRMTTVPERLTEEELNSWKDGFMYFNHADSAALVDKLERWFDVEVSINTGGIPLKKLNCGFRNATLIEVLNHIAPELNMEYHIEGQKVFLSRRTR